MALPPCPADAVAAGDVSASAATRTVPMLDDGGAAWRSLLRAREQQAAQLRVWEVEFHHVIAANLERIDALVESPDSPESPETPAACRKRKPNKRSPDACSSSKRTKASVSSPPFAASSSSGTCSAPESGASIEWWQVCLEPAI
eukprot:SM000027S09605  [mRNA]  locus=s27:325132:325727:+ [translate_table: standard]